MRPTAAYGPLTGLLFLALASSPRPAHAHGATLSYLDLAIENATVTGTLDLSVDEVTRALNVDADRDGITSPAEIAAAGGELGTWVGGIVRLVADGANCRSSPDSGELRPNATVSIRARWTCEGTPRNLYVATGFKRALGDGHSVFVRVRRGDWSKQELLTDDRSAVAFRIDEATGPLGVATKFVLLGLEHIVTGYDHLLFLLALVLVGGGLRRVVLVATAFTLAHSITLSLAALQVLTLPSRPVEIAIAASIAWVAAENLLIAAPVPPGAPEPWPLRWRTFLTFAFGLVHGFGFAGLLVEIGLPQQHLVLALGTFNLGVELGQVAVLAAVSPLVLRLSRLERWRPNGVRIASTGVLLAALYWVVERVRENGS